MAICLTGCASRTVFLGGSAFGSNSAGDGLFTNAISGFGLASFTPRSTRGDVYNSIQIPLAFPKGTVLEDIELSFYDNDEDHNIEFKLWGQAFTHGFVHYAVGNYVSSGSSTSIQTAPFLSNPFTLEFDASYWIEVRAIADGSNPNAPTWGGSLGVRMAKVRYTLP
jgi:hypothetical protein